jgi:hypothetical protein
VDPRRIGRVARRWLATAIAGSLIIAFAAVAGTGVTQTGGARITSASFQYGQGGPAVVTGVASEIKATTATLNATVNPNGAAVIECKFEYGKTASLSNVGTQYGFNYEASVPCSPGASELGMGGSPVAVFAAISGLEANATYHFRISARNAEGTSEGTDATFETVGPPVVDATAASAITESSATLSGTVNPKGGEVTGCKFEYSTDQSHWSPVLCAGLPGSGRNPVAVSAQVNGLTAGTTYYFRISATNEAATEVSLPAAFQTLSPPTGTGGPSPPSPPSSCGGSVTVKWPDKPMTIHSRKEEIRFAQTVVKIDDSVTPSAEASEQLLPKCGPAPSVQMSPLIAPATPFTVNFNTSFGGVTVGLDKGDISGQAGLSADPPYPNPATWSPPSVAELIKAAFPKGAVTVGGTSVGGVFVIPLGTWSRTLTLTMMPTAPLIFTAMLKSDTAMTVEIQRYVLEGALVAVTAVAVVLPPVVASIAEWAAVEGFPIASGTIADWIETYLLPEVKRELPSLVNSVTDALSGKAQQLYHFLVSHPSLVAVKASASSATAAGQPTSEARVLALRASDLKGLGAQWLRGPLAKAAQASLLTLPFSTKVRPLVASPRLSHGGGTVTLLGGDLPGTKAQLVISGPGYAAVRDVRINHGVAGGRIVLPSGRRPGRWYAGIVDYGGLRALHGRVIGHAILEAASWVASR